ncbi:MAG: hypothetical protein ACFFBI_09490, partial [Promethearchaeota archaeon]
TYKYSNAEYTRKYLGLTQARKLIQTYPFRKLNKDRAENLSNFIEEKEVEKVKRILKACKKECD